MTLLYICRYTHYASIGLFFYFGYKLLAEAIEMYRNPTHGKNEELEEVEQELGESKSDVESGKHSAAMQAMRLSVLTQAFTLTFLAGELFLIV